MNRYRLIALDQDGDPLEVTDHPTVKSYEDAANAEAGETLEWMDARTGLEALKAADLEHLINTGCYPARWWQVIGLDEDGEECEYTENFE